MATRPKAKKETPSIHKKDWSYKDFRGPISRRNTYQIIAWIVGPIACLTIIAQLLYPSDHGLLFASIQGRSLTMASHSDMAKAIVDQFDKTKVKLTVGSDKSVEFSLKSAGAEPNTEAMIDFLSDYPLWQRFIPGSILWQSGELSVADVYYSGKPFDEFVGIKSKELTFPPQNARLAIKDGRLEATEAISGSAVNSHELLQTISKSSIQLGKTTVVEAPAKRQAAARTSKDLAKVHQQAEAVLAHTVSLDAGGKKFLPDKKELASWVVLATNDKGDVTLSVDKEKIKAYLAQVNNEVGTPAGQTNITIVDGREAGRTTGATGRAIAIDSLADQLAAGLLVPPPAITATAQFVEVQPSIIFNSKYTATQAGLQAYLDDVARSRNMHIVVQQLDGGGWSAAARAGESIPSGSTYKLFVALVLFDKIDRGEIHWEDPMLDTTVAGCFDRMTVASTNPCAESWIAQFGRQYINDFIYARGFSSGTSFTTGSANQTTAYDLNKYMTGLNDGTLVSGANRDRLLNNLGRHPYRYGIPTGSAGTVHDKVGFLWDYVHDTAIVNHPRGNYIMTIMTKGQSYAAIASVTREIERIMYP
jgi:vancomycin resistance protein YoaR